MLIKKEQQTNDNSKAKQNVPVVKPQYPIHPRHV